MQVKETPENKARAESEIGQGQKWSCPNNMVNNIKDKQKKQKPRRHSGFACVWAERIRSRGRGNNVFTLRQPLFGNIRLCTCHSSGFESTVLPTWH